MRIALCLFLCVLFHSGFGQQDSRVVHLPDSFLRTQYYTVYRGDTVNTVDSAGLLQGRGIEFEFDSTLTLGSRAMVMVRDGHGVMTCQAEVVPDVIVYRVRAGWFGKYRDGNRVGLWQYRWPDGSEKLEAKYGDDGRLRSVRMLYDTGELMYSGEPDSSDKRVVLKKFTRGGLRVETITYSVSDLALLGWFE